MKPQLNGNLSELYAAKATKVRRTKTFTGVEWIGRYIDYKTKEPAYNICCAGVNGHGVRIAAYFYPGKDTAYFWQYADDTAVNDILAAPSHAYDWFCVKNGIRN